MAPHLFTYPGLDEHIHASYMLIPINHSGDIMPRVSEDEIALAVMQIATTRPDGLVTFKRAYQEIPNIIKLGPSDLAQSLTRRREKMWQQQVRNIKSHSEAVGNFIERGLLEHVSHVGYRITEAGRPYLKARGLN
jgi:hypothetical protein